MPKLTAEIVQQLLHYNPDTGLLIWLPRDPVNRFIRAWNTKYAGKVAGTIGKLGYVHFDKAVSVRLDADREYNYHPNHGVT